MLAHGFAAVSEAGTVVRGRVQMPAPVPAPSAGGGVGGEPPDVRATVIYVTQPEKARKKLKRKRTKETVTISGNQFAPEVLVVGVGSKIRFTNPDRIYHNVFSVSPAQRFDLGKLPPGATRELQFDRAGVVQLFCDLHPATAGFVIVTPNRYHTRAAASGEYVLPSLPKGTYVVNVWHPRLGASRRTIEVSGRGDHTLDLRL